MSGPYQQQPTPPQQPGPPYGAPEPVYETPGQQYGTSSGTVYGSPGQQYGTPGPAYGGQGQQYGAPAPAYGAQGQQYGAPAPAYEAQGQQYGAPAPAYGAQAPQYGAPTGYPAPPAVPERGRNGFAITALIFGIIGGIPLALGFAIAGLVRAGKVKRGKVMSIVAIVLALLWIIPVVALTQRVEKLADPGCIQAENLARTFEAKVQADSSNPTALKSDLTSTITQLNDAAAKSNNDTARTAIKKLSADISELLDDLNNAKVPSSDLQTRLTTDGDAVDTACGRV